MDTKNSVSGLTLPEYTREIAYRIYLTGKNNDQVKDWLEAESEVKKIFRYLYQEHQKIIDDYTGNIF